MNTVQTGEELRSEWEKVPFPPQWSPHANALLLNPMSSKYSRIPFCLPRVLSSFSLYHCLHSSPSQQLTLLFFQTMKIFPPAHTIWRWLSTLSYTPHPPPLTAPSSIRPTPTHEITWYIRQKPIFIPILTSSILFSLCFVQVSPIECQRIHYSPADYRFSFQNCINCLPPIWSWIGNCRKQKNNRIWSRCVSDLPPLPFFLLLPLAISQVLFSDPQQKKPWGKTKFTM